MHDREKINLVRHFIAFAPPSGEALKAADAFDELTAALDRSSRSEAKLEEVRRILKRICDEGYIDERAWEDWERGDGFIAELMAATDGT